MSRSPYDTISFDSLVDGGYITDAGIEIMKSASDGGVSKLVEMLEKIGANGNSQNLYDLMFCLWALSLRDDIDLKYFLSSPSIPVTSDLVAAAPSRKVVRMAIGYLCNLAKAEDPVVLTEMFSYGIEKSLDAMIQSNSLSQAADPEFENDAKLLYDILMKNYRELTSFDRWATEVTTGALRWGILHTEKFFKENSKFIENEEFSLLKRLIVLLNSEDVRTQAIALYDIGEFARFYPGGRTIIATLGGKDKAMAMIDSGNPDVARHALACISKIMVSNWEHVKN